MSSIFDVFKSNKTKIAEQQEIILDLQANIAGRVTEVEALEEEAEHAKGEITKHEAKIHDLTKEIDRVESNKKIQIDEMKADRTLHDNKVTAEREMHDEKMKHLVVMKTEALAVDHDKKVIELERKSASEISEVKSKYQDKMEKQLQNETKNIKEMYNQILTRLPNLNASMHLGGQKDADKDSNS